VEMRVQDVGASHLQSSKVPSQPSLINSPGTSIFVYLHANHPLPRIPHTEASANREGRDWAGNPDRSGISEHPIRDRPIDQVHNHLTVLKERL
jgi:hypothetical protein